MYAVQTLWTLPRVPGRDDLARWALSCRLAKRHYGRVVLFTDSVGKRILVDELRLPYDDVELSLDDVPSDFSPVLWGFAKVLTYRLCAARSEPFLHLDDDVFLFKRLKDIVTDAPIFAQNFESPIYYRRSSHLLQPRERGFITEETRWAAYNLGVVGGHDYEFFDRYTREAIDAFEKLSRRRAGGLLNVVAEQAVFGKVARDMRRRVACVLTGGHNDAEASTAGYCHLMLGKQSTGIAQKVHGALKHEFGERVPDTKKTPSVQVQLPSAAQFDGLPVEFANYNGGQVTAAGRRVLFYRTHRPITGPFSAAGSSVAACRVDGRRTFEHRQILFPGHPQFVEDPRPFVFRGDLYLAVTYASHSNNQFKCEQRLFKLDEKHRPFHEVELPRTGVNEKNWQFFDHNGSLHAVYHPSGHDVVDLSSGMEYSSVPLAWGFGKPSGGTPPVLVGGYYYSFFHSFTPHARHFRQYHVGLYRFEAKPPFRPELITRTPILSGSEEDGWCADPETLTHHPLVVFPCSAELDGKSWNITFGVNDSFLFSARWPVVDGGFDWQNPSG